jgi:quercetin dioxygenase-like cupin family protein
MEIKFHGGGDNEPFIVETIAPGGCLLESHKHKHAHTSVLVSGCADVTVDGITRRFDGYSIVSIPADTVHSVLAVTDIVWLCIWSGDVAPIDQAIDSLKLVAA